VMTLASSVGDGGVSVSVTLTNHGSGHAFPTGVTDIVEAWVELDAVNASGTLIQSYGGPDATTGVLPSTAARLGIDIADSKGNVLYKHQLSQAFSVPFDRRVPPGGSLDVAVTGPTSLPTGATELDAVLYYRNIRTTYYQAATGSSTASVTPVEMARVKVQ